MVRFEPLLLILPALMLHRRKKYPLGMALYDACGGVVTDKEDEWYDGGKRLPPLPRSQPCRARHPLHPEPPRSRRRCQLLRCVRESEGEVEAQNEGEEEEEAEGREEEAEIKRPRAHGTRSGRGRDRIEGWREEEEEEEEEAEEDNVGG